MAAFVRFMSAFRFFAKGRSAPRTSQIVFCFFFITFLLVSRAYTTNIPLPRRGVGAYANFLRVDRPLQFAQSIDDRAKRRDIAEDHLFHLCIVGFQLTRASAGTSLRVPSVASSFLDSGTLGS